MQRVNIGHRTHIINYQFCSAKRPQDGGCTLISLQSEQCLTAASGKADWVAPQPALPSLKHRHHHRVLLQRLRADSTPRPLLQEGDPGARLGELLAQRQPLYAQADLRVQQVGDSPAQVAQQVLADLPALLKDPAAVPEAPVELRQADGQITPSLN